MSGSAIPAGEVKDRLYGVVRSDDPFERKAEEALRIGVEYLGVENGHLTRIDQRTEHWEAVVSTDPPDGEFPPGLELDLETTYCRRTIEADSQVSLHDAPNQGWEDDPAFQKHGLHCYHGTTLVLADGAYGTVCFVSEEPREAFSQDEMLLLELLARLLERELERQQHEVELTKQANLAAVLNRVLRHNLRNDLSIIRGHTQLMADKLDEEGAEETALRNIDELIELSDKARELDQIIAVDDQRTSTDVVPLVRTVCEELEREYPDASVTVEFDEAVTVPVRDNFRRAVEELVENAVKHSGEGPTVTVEVALVPNAVEIRVTDDGPGLSNQEAAVLETGEETPLSHGSGLGLWLVHWVVTNHGGSTTVSADDEGTTMTVQLPRNPATNVQEQLARLSRARDRYHAAFQEACDAMVIVNDEARIVEANPASRTIYGLPSQELLGRTIREFLPDSFDFDAAWEQFRNVGEERDTLTMVGADGTERPVEYSASAEFVPGQHLVISRDISDRSARKQALEERSLRLEAIIGASPDPVLAVDDDGIIQLWNEAAEELFQYDREAVVGRSVLDLDLHEGEQRSVFKERFDQALGGKEFEDVVVERANKHGETKHLKISTAPIRNPSGAITGVVAVCKDVTETVEQRRRFEALSNGFPDICFIIDENGVYREVLSNPANEDKLYVDPSEFSGMSVDEVLPSDAAKRTRIAVEETIETEESRTIEYDLTVPAGRRVFEARMAPLELKIDSSPTVSCIVRDITELRGQATEGTTGGE